MSHVCKSLIAGAASLFAVSALSQVASGESPFRGMLLSDESVRITRLVIDVADQKAVQFELGELSRVLPRFTVSQRSDESKSQELLEHDVVFSLTITKTDDRGTSIDGSFDLVYRLEGLGSLRFQDCRNFDIREKGRFDLPLPAGLENLYDLSERQARQRCLEFEPQQIELLPGCAAETELGTCSNRLADAICGRQYAVSRSINGLLASPEPAKAATRDRFLFYGEGDPDYDEDPVKELLGPLRAGLVIDGKQLEPNEAPYLKGAVDWADVFQDHSGVMAVSYSAITGTSLSSRFQTDEHQKSYEFELSLSGGDLAGPLNVYRAAFLYSEALQATTDREQFQLLNDARLAMNKGCKTEAANESEAAKGSEEAKGSEAVKESGVAE